MTMPRLMNCEHRPAGRCNTCNLQIKLSALENHRKKLADAVSDKEEAILGLLDNLEDMTVAQRGRCRELGKVEQKIAEVQWRIKREPAPKPAK